MLATKEGLVCRAPAKLNLHFELIARREDGYHDVETLMVPVSIYDTLYFRKLPKHSENPDGSEDTKQKGEIHFTMHSCFAKSGSVSQRIPADQRNLVVQALELLQQRSGTECGAKVILLKRIPALAGLGGGSSDAAAALKLANRSWGLQWSRKQLMDLAKELGSDVPFFLSRGAAIGRGRGEQIESLCTAGKIYAVVVVPPDGLSTPDVYRASQVPTKPRQIEPAIVALQTGSLRQWSVGGYNRLEHAARVLSPWIDRIRDAMESVGCPVHQMTGSGSGYFGLCRHLGEARRMAARLRAQKIGQVFAVSNVR